MWMRSVSLANYFYQLHKSKLGSGRFIHTEITAEGSGALDKVYSLFIREVGVTCAMALLWSSGDNFQALSLSFHQVGPGDQTQVVRLS